MPEILRKAFYQQAQAVFDPFMRCGRHLFRCCLQGASEAAPPGRLYRRHPDAWPQWAVQPASPLIATSGGWDPQAASGHHLDYIPYRLLRKKWQWHLLTMLRQTVQTDGWPGWA